MGKMLWCPDFRLSQSIEPCYPAQEALHVALRASGGTAAAGAGELAAELAEEKSRLRRGRHGRHPKKMVIYPLVIYGNLT